MFIYYLGVHSHYKLKINGKKYNLLARIIVGLGTGKPGSVMVPKYSSSKITVFLWGKNTILKFLGNTI